MGPGEGANRLPAVVAGGLGRGLGGGVSIAAHTGEGRHGLQL